MKFHEFRLKLDRGALNSLEISPDFCVNRERIKTVPDFSRAADASLLHSSGVK